MTTPSEWKRAVFTTTNGAIAVRDVVDAACFRGELERSCGPLLLSVESEKLAADLEAPDDAVLQTTSEKFRYERDLITAEETESWLEKHGLTPEEFSGHFLRHHWRNALHGKVVPGSCDYVSASGEFRNLLRIELVLSGEFERLAVQSSWRYAAFATAASELTPRLIEAEGGHFRARTGFEAGAITGWLAQLGRDQGWFDEMLALEAAYRRECEAVLTPEARERMLRSAGQGRD